MVETTQPTIIPYKTGDGRVDILHVPALPKQLTGWAIPEPLKHISVSQINKWLSCQTSWASSYLLHQKSKMGWPVALGSIVDTTVTHYYDTLINTGKRETISSLTDHYDNTFTNLTDKVAEGEEDNYELDETKKTISHQKGRSALTTYIDNYGQNCEPTKTQPGYRGKLSEETEWNLLGFLDYELDTLTGTRICDLKVSSQKYTDVKAANALQPTFYYLLKALEQDTIESFEFHVAHYGRAQTAEKINAGFDIAKTYRTSTNIQALINTISKMVWDIVNADDIESFTGAAPMNAFCNYSGCAHYNNCQHIGWSVKDIEYGKTINN